MNLSSFLGLSSLKFMLFRMVREKRAQTSREAIAFSSLSKATNLTELEVGKEIELG